jgi:hypothetical protein
MPSPNGSQLEVRVYNAFDVKDVLKDRVFRLDSSDKSWFKAVPGDAFSWDKLLAARWHGGRVRVEVRDEAGDIVHRDGGATSRAAPAQQLADQRER